MQHFISGKLIGFDTETTGVYPWHGDRPYLFSFINPDGETASFHWRVNPFTRKVEPVEEDVDALRSIVTDRSITLGMHNAKFDIRMVELSLGIKWKAKIEDSLILAHCFDSLEAGDKRGGGRGYGLKDLSVKYLGDNKNAQDRLHKITTKARRIAKKLGWKLGKVVKENNRGELVEKGTVEADYWMPREIALLHPEKLRGKESVKEWLSVCESYCVDDTMKTLALIFMYRDAMNHTEGMAETYRDEMDLFPINYRMEKRGIRFDRKLKERQVEKWKERQQNVVKEMAKEIGRDDFNPASNTQVAEYLFDFHNLPETPDRTTSKLALEGMIDKEPVRKILLHRTACKIIGYYNGCDWTAINDSKGLAIIHPDFQQRGPATGRYSCRTPNIQQASKNNEEAAELLPGLTPDDISTRKPFGPRPGYVWYAFDYKQLEVIVYAYMMQEPFMLDAIRRGLDIHGESANKAWGGETDRAYQIACKLLHLDNRSHYAFPELEDLYRAWNITPKQVRKMPRGLRYEYAHDWLLRFNFDIVKAEASLGGRETVRQGAKAIIFGKIFGAGVGVAVRQMGCDYDEGAELWYEFDLAFPKIVQNNRLLTKQAERDCYVLDARGHRISVDPEWSYRAPNYITQGSAASLIKRAMVRCNRWVRRNRIDAHIVMQIHDELVFEVSKRHDSLKVVRKLKSIMEDTEGAIDVPTPVTVEKVVKCWDSKVKVKV